jgi:hypothetical protein
MKRQHRLQNHLLQEADKILRVGTANVLARNVGRGGSCSDAIRAQNRARMDVKRGAANSVFRQMPKDDRKVLTERFKTLTRAKLTRQGWLDWLVDELDRGHGLSLQRTPAGDLSGCGIGR